MNFVDELKWRGMIHDIMPGTEEQLAKGETTAYVGIDPTADSLHIGHLVSVMMMKHFQMAGHKPIFIIGGATGMIGDPSGKSQERNLLDEETIHRNMTAIKAQLSRFIDFNSSASNAAIMLNNYDWMKDFSFLDFIREVGKHITVNYMMAKDSVKKRLSSESAQGMSFPSQYKEYNMTGDCISWLAGAIKNGDSLVGFGTIDFDSGDITGQVNRIADLGFRGIKLHPAYQEFNIMGDKACEVYSAAQENGLFLSFHTGLHWHRIADYQPLLFDEVAWNFPRLKFSMEHVGGYHFFREALAVICNNHHRASDPRRVYAGLTSIMPDDNGLPDYWTLSDDELLTLIHQGDDDCAIFGLDFPYKKADYAKALINRIISLDISEEAKEGILGKNLEHALGMD